MVKLKKENDLFQDTFIQGEKSPFEESVPIKQEEPVEKKKLPKIKIQKRILKQNRAFYIVGLAISLLVFVVGFFDLAAISAAILYSSGVFLTEPARWQSEKLKTARWNLSVTLSVFIKSLHLNIFEWRNVLLWTIVPLLVLSSINPSALTGVFFSLLLLLGFVFYASKNFAVYLTTIRVLAWLMMIWGSVCVLFSGYSIGLATMAFILFQVYERLNGVELEFPLEDELF